ncbi:MAG: peptide chain release factor-like protein [Gemmatimonadota bacterium]|nr:peptide chain release factor-like protein [Gemmatimonadota bacterium]
MAEHLEHSGVPIPKSNSELLGQCRVDVFRSGGKGGQHQNVTESGVRLTHLSTGTVVTSRRFRSQLANKRNALVTLRKRLAALNEREKERVPTRPSRRVQERRLSSRQRHSSKKTLRQKPKLDDD